nr:MAG TPA: hypothetical protein [Caudoviricetes sp.]
MSRVWLNGRKPPYMDSPAHDMNADKALYAVKNMTRDGLQLSAAGCLLFRQRLGFPPADMTAAIEDIIDGNKNDRKTIRLVSLRGNDTGGDAA